MYQKRKFHHWVRIVADIFEVPERLKELTITEKKELLLHLNERLSYLQKISVERYNGTNENLEYSLSNTYQYGYNYYSIENMIAYINDDVDRYIKVVDDPIFEPNIAKDFFEYCIENWILKTNYKKTALSYLFNQMWHERKVAECQYKIKSDGTTFAKYWNLQHSGKSGLELNEKNPKFKNDITATSYQIEFKRMLEMFSK